MSRGDPWAALPVLISATHSLKALIRPTVRPVPLTPTAVRPVYDQLQAMLPAGSRLALIVHADRLHLELIEVHAGARSQGHGERLMVHLCQIADAHRWTLTLRISSAFGSDPAILRTWYSRHGFEPGEGREMRRVPGSGARQAASAT